MMASQQSSITSTSTPKKPGPMPPPRSTTSTGRTTSNATPTISTQAPVLTDAVQKCVDTAAEAIATHRGDQVSLYARSSAEDLEGGIQRTYNSPFSWDTTSTECLSWSSSTC